MKKFMVILSMLVGLVGSFSFLSSAQAGTESFRQTCNVRYEDYYRIQADCLDMSGNWQYNDFQRNGCNGDIANINGRIICSGGYTPAPPPAPYPAPYPAPGGLPGGSYIQSCQSCYMNGAQMSCQCLDMSGNWHNTYINTRACRTPIANTNGRLTCG